MSLLSDAEALKDMPLPEIRENIATKVAMYLDKGVFDGTENNIAYEIIRLLTKDVEVRVRKAIADSLKSSKNLPRDIALRLASDVLEVSLPILEFSNVLTNSDLVAIISSTQQVAKLIAISRRDNLAEVVSSELLATKNEDVVVSLFSNKTAKISQGSMEYTINLFRDNGKVVNSLMNRGNLDIGIVEKILNVVSGEIRNELIAKHQLDPEKAHEILQYSQERATLGLLDDVEEIPPETQRPLHSGARVVQTENLVNHLFREGRLTESLIFRSLCEGNFLFFETSVAKLAGIPIVNARTLINDGNDVALKSLWKRAKLPDSAFDAMNIIINFALIHPAELSSGQNFRNHLLSYIQEHGYDKTVSLMPYFVAIVASSVVLEDVV